MQREMNLSMLNSRIQQVISTEPSWTGMTSHVASNGSAIYLSYADRKCALDPKNSDAASFRYPVWLHFPFDGSMRNGTGGLNYKTPTDMHDNAIKALINSVVPFSNAQASSANDDINNYNDNNNNNNCNNYNKFPLVPNHTPERSKNVFLGLTSIFLTLIKMRADRFGIITEGSRKNARSGSQDHMEDKCIDGDDTDDSWTSMSE